MVFWPCSTAGISSEYSCINFWDVFPFPVTIKHNYFKWLCCFWKQILSFFMNFWYVSAKYAIWSIQKDMSWKWTLCPILWDPWRVHWRVQGQSVHWALLVFSVDRMELSKLVQMLFIFRLSTQHLTPALLPYHTCRGSVFKMLTALKLAIRLLVFGYVFLIRWIIAWTLLKVLLWEFGSYKTRFIISLFAFSLFLINKSWFRLSQLLWWQGLVMHREFCSLLTFEMQRCGSARKHAWAQLEEFVILRIVTSSQMTLSCSYVACSLSERGEVICGWIPGGMTWCWNSGSGISVLYGICYHRFSFIYLFIKVQEMCFNRGRSEQTFCF